MPDAPPIPPAAVRLLAEGDRVRAQALARRLGLPLEQADGGEPRPDDDTVRLEVGRGALALRLGAGPRVPAAAEALRPPRAGGRDLLRRAVGRMRPGGVVVDATAGLGADGFHLAATGMSVVMIERLPLALVLLEDALARAALGDLGPEAAEAAARVRLLAGDARTLLPGLEPRPEVVVCDPMYPQRGKRSRTTKGMALFRRLGGADPDGPALLSVARAAATRRVVVKRPRRAAPLGGVSPSGSVVGTTTRFDLYAPYPASS